MRQARKRLFASGHSIAYDINNSYSEEPQDQELTCPECWNPRHEGDCPA